MVSEKKFATSMGLVLEQLDPVFGGLGFRPAPPIRTSDVGGKVTYARASALPGCIDYIDVLMSWGRTMWWLSALPSVYHYPTAHAIDALADRYHPYLGGHAKDPWGSVHLTSLGDSQGYDGTPMAVGAEGLMGAWAVKAIEDEGAPFWASTGSVAAYTETIREAMLTARWRSGLYFRGASAVVYLGCEGFEEEAHQIRRAMKKNRKIDTPRDWFSLLDDTVAYASTHYM